MKAKQTQTQTLADNAFIALSKVLEDIGQRKTVTMSVDKYLHISVHAGFDFHAAFCRVSDRVEAEKRKIYPAIIIKAKDEDFFVLYKRADIKKAQVEIEYIPLSKTENNFELCSLSEKKINSFKEVKAETIGFRITAAEKEEKMANIMGDNGEPIMTMGEYAKLAFMRSYVIDRTAPFVLELIEETIYHQSKIGNNINQVTKLLHQEMNDEKITELEFDMAINEIIKLEQVLSDLLFKIEHLS